MPLRPEGYARAIRKLRRRRDDLLAVDPSELRTSVELIARAQSLVTTTNETLEDTFGALSTEARRARLYMSALLPSYVSSDTTSSMQLVEEFTIGLHQAISKIETEISILEEKLRDFDENNAQRVVSAYEGLALHPAIATAASQLYRDGHYANAIEDAIKALNNLVRLRSGLEIDGVQLMQRAFAPANPTLRLNDLSSQSDRDEQQGFMFLFSGAVAALRNPRAHDLIKDDPEYALECIAFISFLAKALDGTQR